MKIFWSWQDDSPGKTNRNFIKAALDDAVASIEGDYEAEDADRPSLDHDTKGVAGAKEIVPALMAKIAGSAVFVADVTPIGETSQGKALPNPNVMVELGWSLNKPGDGRQIYILNTADGWKIEQLPFDIRHRRVLTYSLAEAADAKMRERVRKQLVKELIGAITINLNDHLDEQAQAAPIVGVQAKADEPSIWAGSEAGFSFQDSYKQWIPVKIANGPRAYLRVIPSGWKEAAPDVATIEDLPQGAAPHANGHHTSGNFGSTKDGYVRFWFNDNEPLITEDFAMYFDATGEFWFATGSAISQTANNGPRVMGLATAYQSWSAALRRSNWVLDQFGAFPARRVEVGFTGLDHVRFPGGWGQAGQLARRGEVKYEETRRDWGVPGVQENFLVDALGEIFSLFALPKLSPQDAKDFVAKNDGERGARNPFSR